MIDLRLRLRARLRFVDGWVSLLTGASGSVGDAPDKHEDYHENEQVEPDVAETSHWNPSPQVRSSPCCMQKRCVSA